MDARSYENTTEKKRIQLHVQAASPNKLPENRSLRDHVTVDGEEIVQEFEKPFCLIILFPVSRDIKEQRFRIKLQYRKLIHKRGVKHHIGALLVREDILILTAAHRRPALDRLLRGGSSRSRVPHHPADQSSVSRRDPVVLIHIQLGQGADVDLKFTLLRKF